MAAVRPTRLVGGICVVGLLLTGLAAGAAARVDRNSEQDLLEGQTEQAALVLSTAIFAIEQPLAATLDALEPVPAREDAASFDRLFTREVGADKMFVSASLWQQDGRGFSRVTSLGVRPALREGAEARDFLGRALSADTEVIELVEVGGQSRIAYAMGRADSGTVLYAERVIPEDRRAAVDEDSAFADLDYAIYLGPDQDLADLTTTSVDPADLPLEGVTHATEIPFGDTVLTFTTSPRRHLGSSLGQWLPLVLLASGLLLTLIAALVALKLVRSRSRAEQTPRRSPRSTSGSTPCTASSEISSPGSSAPFCRRPNRRSPGSRSAPSTSPAHKASTSVATGTASSGSLRTVSPSSWATSPATASTRSPRWRERASPCAPTSPTVTSRRPHWRSAQPSSTSRGTTT